MSNKSGFVAGLNKSTKITVFSCIGFIILTCIILMFFILFPITPSEKIMASIGRENVLNGGSNGSSQSAVVGVVTTSSAAVTENMTTRPVSTTGRTVKIVITTGSGFLWNGRIPTGVTPGETFPTTAVDDPDTPTPDPGYPGGDTPPYTTPDDPNGENNPPATTPSDPGGGDNPSDPNGGDTPPIDNPNPPDNPSTDNPDYDAGEGNS